MENTTRNSWRRGSCIGRGAYGTVNAGVNLSTGEVFAVKSVNLATASPSHVEALENEIATLKSLSSPFIVKYLRDDTTSEGSPSTSFRNLHMEYMPTGTAADVADKDESDVASYTWCLISALSYLHSRGIVHCDVKGRNVLLGRETGCARLADFGSAVDMSSSGGGALPRGSPLWMAPEVVRGEYQGAESDVWSVGCTIIEMLTGKPAWGVESGSVYRIGYSDEIPLFPARLSSCGVDFLEKCLRRDYKRRWSCDQLLQHPFLSMGTHKFVDNHSSPRCVLDFFNSDFHAEEEEEGEEMIVDLDGDERMRGLISPVVVNWESDGWVVVRDGSRGSCSECSDFAADGTGRIDSNLDSDPLNDVVASQCQHFNHGNFCNNGNSYPQCTQVVKRLNYSDFPFVYDELHLFLIFREITNRLSNISRPRLYPVNFQNYVKFV